MNIVEFVLVKDAPLMCADEVVKPVLPVLVIIVKQLDNILKKQKKIKNF